MTKETFSVKSLAVSKDKLVAPVSRYFLSGRFLERLPEAVENVVSPEFGSSDLLFLDEKNGEVTAVRINAGNDVEKFVVEALSYGLWLQEAVAVAAALFRRQWRLEVYLFSPDFTPVRRLVQGLAGKIRTHLVEYELLPMEDRKEPVICFRERELPELPAGAVAAGNGERESPGGELPLRESLIGSLGISEEELKEFERLKAQYLP